MSLLFAVIVGALIPLARWMPLEMEDRSHWLFYTAAAAVLYWSFFGTAVPLDLVNSAVLVLGGYLVVQTLWSESRIAKRDLFFWLSLMVVFVVGRNVSMYAVAVSISVTGLFYSGWVFQQALKKKKTITGFMGNNNHSAVALILPIFTSLDMAVVQPFWLAITFPCIVAMVMLGCRGAVIGVFAGAVALWPDLIFPACLGGYLIFVWKGGDDKSRMSFIISAVRMIVRKPIFGYGLRTFRKYHPDNVIAIRLNKDLEIAATHRVHNDLLETLFEMGIVGVALLGVVIFPVFSNHSMLMAGVVGVLAASMFFYPLREAHTAAPFWLLCGSIVGYGGETLAPVLKPASLIGLVVLAAVAGMIPLTYAMICYWRACKSKDLKKQLHLIDEAIKHDPYNAKYLGTYALNPQMSPQRAFECIARIKENWDGDVTPWQMYDCYGKVAMSLGIELPKSAFRKALYYNPNHVYSQGALKKLETAEKKIMEEQIVKDLRELRSNAPA